jgi:hypothetical protein
MKRAAAHSLTSTIRIGVAVILGCAAAAAQAQTSYKIISTTQVLVNVGCPSGCSATLTGTNITASEAGVAAAVMTSHLPNPSWTLVTFSDSPFSKPGEYSVSLSQNAATVPQTVLILVNTKPTIQLVQGAGKLSVKLTSNVAFALPGPGPAIALQFNLNAKSCPNNSRPLFAPVMLEYPGLEISFEKTPFCHIDLTDLDPEAVGVIQGVLIHLSTKSTGKKKALPSTIGAPIIGVKDVLNDQLNAPGTPTLSQPKAPTNQGSAWLWIDGTVTAGTGAAPAWVLDGKLAPWTSLSKATKWTWAEADANIGNNKIGGQSAKDVIDFIGPYPTYYRDWSALGAQMSASPTYETNLELSHRNMLAAGDILWGFTAINKTVLVRNALAHRADLTKVPKQGDFKTGNSWGESFNIRTGFQGGGALAPVTVTNSKTKATVGTIPTYSIARFVPQSDGTLQYRWFVVESDVTGLYLFTTEHTAVNDKSGNPYLETVRGWKASNVLTTTYTPGSNQNIKFTVKYTNGFSAPTYQRANGVQIGLAVAY